MTHSPRALRDHSSRRSSLLARSGLWLAIIGVLSLLAVPPVAPSALGASAEAVGGEGVTSPRYHRLGIDLSTMSDGVAITVPDGGRVTNVVVEEVDGGDVQWTSDGVLLIRTVPSRASATVTAIVEDSPALEGEWLHRAAQRLPTASRVMNLNDPADPVVLGEISTRRRSETFVIEGDELRHNGPLDPGAAERSGLVLAHWVPRHRSGDYSGLPNAPLYPNASTLDPHYVEHAVGQAAGAGIDGFVTTWAPYLAEATDVIMDVAEARVGFSVGFQLNVRYSNTQRTSELPPDPMVVADHLVHLWDTYATRSPTLRLADGRMVVFAYQAGALSPEQWELVLADVAGREARVVVVGGNIPPSHLQVLDGYFVYNNLQHEDLAGFYAEAGEHTRTYHLAHDGEARKLWVATATPGLQDREDKWRVRSYDRLDGDRYRSQWAAVESSFADWVYIVSWNEYAEDTTIEPSERWGTTYLELTAELSGSWESP